MQPILRMMLLKYNHTALFVIPFLQKIRCLNFSLMDENVHYLRTEHSKQNNSNAVSLPGL